ncbi:MAG: MBL fold metallo-hydrolase [Spirochaetes bacterium]|nr:MBL fold metallo-hydrolase [Spirochaetota bacterium]
MKLYFQYSPYGSSNVFLLGCDETGDAILVDPAEFTVNLLRFIEKNGYYVRTVLVTHNHKHHIRGIATLMKIYEARIYASKAMICDFPSTVVRDGDRFDLCRGLDAEVLSVPGHSSDSLAFRIGKLVFTGDTLQAGLIGSTISKYGNALLRRSISQKILNLADDTILLPGHGPPSTVGAEKRFNLGFDDEAKKNRTRKYDLFL